MKISIILSVVILLLSGCVKQPDIPTYHLKNSDKVGYIIQPSGDVYHGHMGTTIFNNMEKTYAYKWELEKNIQRSLAKNVHKKMINLSKYNIKYSDIKDMIVAKDGQWTIGKRDQYNRLLNKLHLKAILLINQETTYVFTGRDPIVMNTSGFASHHLIGLKRYFAVSAYDFNLYLLKPKAVIRVKEVLKSEMIYDSLITSSQGKSGFKKPEDIDNITKEELEVVRKKVIQLIDDSTKSIDKYLK
jgi:hypothetical protein